MGVEDVKALENSAMPSQTWDPELYLLLLGDGSRGFVCLPHLYC